MRWIEASHAGSNDWYLGDCISPAVAGVVLSSDGRWVGYMRPVGEILCIVDTCEKAKTLVEMHLGSWE